MTTQVSARATKHRNFSFGRVSAIASNTVLELIRLKVFYILVLFALAVIASSLFQAKITFQDQFQILKDVSLGAMSIFTWLLATLSTAMLLPKDIEDRTLYTILAKPVPRFEYLLGKLLGIMAMLLLALVLMSAMMAVVLYLREAVVLADEAAQTPPDLRAQRLAEIRATAFNPNLIPGVLVIYVKAVVIATVTLLISTFSSSWIFTIFISTAVISIGHLQGTARNVLMEEHAHGFFTSLFTATIAILFPDMQIFSLVDDIAVGTAVPLLLFVKAFGLGSTYVFMYFLVGYISFAFREL